MSKQTINIGASPNDGTGTPLRTSFDYTNQNFTELYTAVGPSGNNIVVPGTATITGALTVDTTTLVVDATNDRVGVNTATFDTNWGPKLQTSSASTDGSGGIVIESYKPNLILKDASSGAQRRHIYADGGVQYFGYGDASITEHLSIGTTGNVSVALGNVVIATSGKGIDFSAVTGGTGTATANVLNDYEEGTWTPTQGTGLTVVGTFSSSGTYTKVGRLVTITGNVNAVTSVSAGAGGIICGALPFSAVQQVAATSMNNTFNAGSFCAVNVTDFYAVTAMAGATSIRFSATYIV